MSEAKTFDLIVLGGGPGGYAAAIRAAQLGGRVALVEQDALGGTCTNRGCIPTKALAASAHLLERIHRSEEMGIRVPEGVELDFSAVAKRRDDIVAELRTGIEGLLKANKVELFRGRGKLTSPKQLRVGEQELKARSVILATGSRPATLPMLPVDGKRVLSSDQLLASQSLPKRLVVVGGGVIGCEFASIYRAFGVEVWVVELMDRLLPTMDAVLSKQLKRAFKQQGIHVLCSSAVQGLGEASKGEGLEVLLPEDERIACDQVLVAVGRKAVTEDLGLEDCGLTLRRGCVETDAHMATPIEGLYAVGDLVGRTWLAHTAAREGEIAAANAMGQVEKMSYKAVPGVVFTNPELAAVGLGPAEVKADKLDVTVGKFLYQASGKALCDGVAEGRVEIICSASDQRVLGGWVAGQEAGILIAEIALAVDLGLTAGQLADVIHAHPTMPEMLAEAAADSIGRAIHRAPARRKRSRLT